MNLADRGIDFQWLEGGRLCDERLDRPRWFYYERLRREHRVNEQGVQRGHRLNRKRFQGGRWLEEPLQRGRQRYDGLKRRLPVYGGRHIRGGKRCQRLRDWLGIHEAEDAVRGIREALPQELIAEERGLATANRP